MSRPVGRATLLALAMLVAQVAWILVVPPFRGIDEFDHAYRATAVAHGDFLPSDRPVLHGRGDYLQVPAATVSAAHPICVTYPYTAHDDCNAVRDLGGGYVEVASGAARYNPVFYWLIGKPASVLSGTANLYALRLLAALLSVTFVFAAGYALSVGFLSRWPLLGVALGGTPVLVYSASLGAPNGVEMCSALALWSSLLALRRPDLGRRREHLLLAVAAVSAGTLVTTRLLGPVWLGLIVVCAALFLGRSRVVGLVRTRRTAVAAASGFVLAATGAALWWTKLASPNSPGHEDSLHLDDPLTNSLAELPLWVFQSIAAFPVRNEPARPVVYAAVLVAFGLALVTAGRRMPWRWWGLLAALTTVWLAVQLAVSVATYEHLGPLWQGRYALPFSVGIPVLVLAAVDRRKPSGPPAVVAGVTGLLLLVAHTVSAVDVLDGELRTSPLAGSASWVTVPPAVIVVLFLAAAALLALAVRSGPRPAGPVDPAGSPEPMATSEERTFDIVMPYYGDVALMKEAVRSVLAQDAGGWHLTVIDDCMPDPEPALWFAALGDPRVTYLRNDRTLGSNLNFAKAVSIARADYLVVMGSDDVMLPHYVSELHRATAAHPDVSVIQPGVEVIDGDGQVVRPVTDRVKAVSRPRSRGQVVLGGERLAARLLFGNWTYFPSLCWRREDVQRIGFRPGYGVVLDLALLVDLALDGGTLLLEPRVSFRYRRHAASYSSVLARTGDRFAEEGSYFRTVAASCRERGWRRAGRAASLHLTSRLHATLLTSRAFGSGDLTAARGLLRHAVTR